MENKINFINIPVTANAVSTQVLPQNPNRKYLLIQNNSPTTIYVSFTNSASIISGIQLFQFWNYEPYKVPTSSIHIITPPATNALNIVIIEGTPDNK